MLSLGHSKNSFTKLKQELVEHPVNDTAYYADEDNSTATAFDSGSGRKTEHQDYPT